MLNYNPPPTYAEVIIQEGDRWVFSPLWLKWFIDLSGQLSAFADGSTVVFTNTSSIGSASGTPIVVHTFPFGPPAMYLVAVTVEGSVTVTDYTAFAVVMTAGATAGATWVNNGAKQKITLSGMDLQVTQTSGSPLLVITSITKIG